jgi:hypothetical protein
LLKLITKINVQSVPMQLTCTASKTAAYNEIKDAIRLRITREIKIETQALTLNLVSSFNLIVKVASILLPELRLNSEQAS